MLEEQGDHNAGPSIQIHLSEIFLFWYSRTMEH